MCAARLEDDRQAGVAAPPAAAPRRSRSAVGTGEPSYAMPRPPPRSRCSSAIPSSRSSRASATSAAAARRSGSRSVICEPTWTCRPTSSSAGRAATARGRSSRASSSGTPNLLILSPVEMCGWLLRVDVGVDAERDARARLPLARRARRCARARPADSALMVLHAEVDRRARAPPRVLPTPVKTICGGNEPGAQRDLDLAARVRVGAAAEPAQQPRDRERRVRLERVVQRVRIAGERVVDRAVALGDASRRCRRRAACLRRRRCRRAARRRRRACRRLSMRIRSRVDRGRRSVSAHRDIIRCFPPDRHDPDDACPLTHPPRSRRRPTA